VTLELADVREHLVDRRERLISAAARTGDEELAGLLQSVDSALARLDRGGWTICAACHVPIEPELLDVAPSVNVCFECLSVDERRDLERDLEGASRVQRALLPPRRLEHDGWEVAWLWEPKGAVSGDHVDLLTHPVANDEGAGGDETEPLHLVLGDVVGKGVAASLLQAHLHALFRALIHTELPMGELLCRANHLFAEATAGASYATLIGARLESDGQIELANAGHPRPLLADQRGVRPVESAGLPLGLFPDACYDCHRLELSPGQVLLAYTDGWTEAARGDEEYGIGRAAAALRRVRDAPLPELLTACRDDMEVFLDGRPRGDDVTLLAVRRVG
jgi:sigma-B regulation protein RsbU (phosphoserine phosphatase)